MRSRLPENSADKDARRRSLGADRAGQRPARFPVASLLVVSLLTAACGTGADIAVVQATAEPEIVTPEGATPETASPESEPESEEAPEPEAEAESGREEAPELPGEPFDLHVPAEGQVVGVVGVAFDDTLEVHELPGESSPLTGELANLADDVMGTGQGRLLPNSIWWRIEWESVQGWVGSGFMAYLGEVSDTTADVVALNGGVVPVTETMLDLGNVVADRVKSADPPSRVVVSVTPTVADLGEITMDVVNIGDDAVKGFRLHVFGAPGEGNFSLMSVESTALCARGVTGDGLCL
jgi:hypothetical protein